jgi:hypothetical protein
LSLFILTFFCLLFLWPLGVDVWNGVRVSLDNAETARRAHIRAATRDRTFDRALDSLRASAQAGQCNESLWKKAHWGGQSGAETPGVVQPVGVEMKLAVCAALADDRWTLDQQEEHGANEMMGVWRRAYPYTGFNGAIVMTAKRPSPDQPYEVTSWGAYPRFDGVLQTRPDSDGK